MLVIAFALPLATMCNEPNHEDREYLEWLVTYGMEAPDDFVHNPQPPYIPLRFRNSYAECSNFVGRTGWTTNQFINELILLFTNNITDAAWTDEEHRRTAAMSVAALGEIPDPTVTNYFRSVMERNDLRGLQRFMIIPMFQYTNLEQDVLDYLKTLCVKTNIYPQAGVEVSYAMIETLDTMPAEMKPAATNRVAKYMYFSILHTMPSRDRMLADFLPAYSNSIQRLNAMWHAASTTTNNFVRTRAQAEVDRLQQLGTNNLANVEWLEE